MSIKLSNRMVKIRYIIIVLIIIFLAFYLTQGSIFKNNKLTGLIVKEIEQENLKINDKIEKNTDLQIEQEKTIKKKEVEEEKINQDSGASSKLSLSITIIDENDSKEE